VSAASRQEAEAQLALDVWTRRLAQWIAAMVVSLGGVDVLSFTGGIGEHAADLRLRVAGELAFLGVELDASANAVTEGDGAIGAGAVRCAVVSSREDLEMTRGAQAVLG
jgi:acetate kinase